MASPFTLEQLDQAAQLVGRYMPPTPQFAWPMLADALGAQVWVKHENHTPTGAFKVRGGLVFVARYARQNARPAGLISATRGNHGQSLAFAGRAFGLKVTLVVPFGNSPDKNAAMRAFGATLIEHGHDFQAAREYAVQLAASHGWHMVPSFHPDLVIGVATYAREFLLGAPELDTVYVPVGLGSGICAHIAVRDLLGLQTEIVGVVAENAAATALSFAAGRAVSTETASTFMDGIACRVPDPDAIEIICKGAARIITVSEDLCADALRLMYSTTHNIAEPAGGVSLAGLLAERDRQQGRRVGVTLTGGNLDAALLATILAGHTPTP